VIIVGAAPAESDVVPIQGDNTAYSVMMARYVSALQHERCQALDSATTALRTACRPEPRTASWPRPHRILS
jgi:hypothetical protein